MRLGSDLGIKLPPFHPAQERGRRLVRIPKSLWILACFAGRSTRWTEGHRERPFAGCKTYGLLGGQSIEGEHWSALRTGGVDWKYGLASNLIALGTVNTDFSD